MPKITVSKSSQNPFKGFYKRHKILKRTVGPNYKKDLVCTLMKMSAKYAQWRLAAIINGTLFIASILLLFLK